MEQDNKDIEYLTDEQFKEYIATDSENMTDEQLHEYIKGIHKMTNEQLDVYSDYLDTLETNNVVFLTPGQEYNVPDLRDGHEGEFFTVSIEEENNKSKNDDYSSLGKEALPYLRQSQFYEFGNYMKSLNDIFLDLPLPEEKLSLYLNTIRDLYNQCKDETLTWEAIQEGLFLDSEIFPILEEYTGTVGTKIKNDISFQYVCIQLAQWEKEEGN